MNKPYGRLQSLPSGLPIEQSDAFVDRVLPLIPLRDVEHWMAPALDAEILAYLRDKGFVVDRRGTVRNGS